jgi:hypothetical protein
MFFSSIIKSIKITFQVNDVTLLKVFTPILVGEVGSSPNKTKKPLDFSRSFFVAGVGFISPRCSEMGQRGEQPKETPIALQSDFFFCSQDDASIT